MCHLISNLLVGRFKFIVYLLFTLLITVEAVYFSSLPSSDMTFFFNVLSSYKLCIIDLIQRVLWEVGMQHRHGEDSLHVPPRPHKTHYYSHTVTAFTDASP